MNVNKTDVESSPFCAWCYANYVETVDHYVKDCPEFRNSHSEEKQRFIRDEKLCLGCLVSSEDTDGDTHGIVSVPRGVIPSGGAVVPQPGSRKAPSVHLTPGDYEKLRLGQKLEI